MPDLVAEHPLLAIILALACVACSYALTPAKPGQMPHDGWSDPWQIIGNLFLIWGGFGILAVIAWFVLPEHCWTVPTAEFNACLEEAQ